MLFECVLRGQNRRHCMHLLKDPTPLEVTAESEGVFVHPKCARMREQDSLQKLSGLRDNVSVAQVQYVPLYAVQATLVDEDLPVICHRNH